MNVNFLNYKQITKSLFILFLQTIILFSNSFTSFGQTEQNQITSINFTNNALIINTSGKISYIESRLQDPDRLIIDIFHCSPLNKNLVTSYKSEMDEDIAIQEQPPDKIRIIIVGESSINRKTYLTNNDRTLITRIARIETEVTDEKELDSKEKESVPGRIKELNLEQEDEETKITLSATKSIKFNTYNLKNPDRLAIDLLNIYPPQANIPAFKKDKFISGIRIGRAASGIQATRIVIDLLKPNLEAKVNSNILGHKLEIKIKEAEEKEIKKSDIRVVIDPGHGGYDTGASYGGFEEKDITLLLSNKLKKSLEKYGIRVFLTRDDDSFLSLAERVEITNSIKPNVFISIHNNAIVTSRVIRGVETYFWTHQSQKLAYLIHKSILSHINIPDHYIRKARFYVIKYTSVPAVLAELGFLSNHDDRKLLISSNTQDEYTKALTEAILKFLDIEGEKKQKSREIKNDKQ